MQCDCKTEEKLVLWQRLEQNLVASPVVDYPSPSKLFKVSAFHQSDCTCFQPWGTVSACREVLLVLLHPDITI